MRDKVVFSSFHQVKGLGRQAVVVYGANGGYFDHQFGRGLNPNVCPNTIYVAMSRALHTLVVCQHFAEDYFSWAPLDVLDGAFDAVTDLHSLGLA